MAKMQMRAGLLSGAALGLVLLGPAAGWAVEPIKTATGTEGADVEAVVVRVEKDVAAAAAPVKASILETQPQSIVTHRFIEQATPETGDYSTTILLAPSIGGISSAGGGVNETNKSTLRGFQDGQYNLTYDGIAFGDTNDPTHHTASYFPSSTIGTAVVDRGPGAAGDLGQANLGGAVHFFSPHVEDTMGASQKATSQGTCSTSTLPLGRCCACLRSTSLRIRSRGVATGAPRRASCCGPRSSAKPSINGAH